MNKEINYEEALKQLQDIVEKMENDEFDIDHLAEQLKTARQLIKLCKDRLSKTEREISEIKNDDE